MNLRNTILGNHAPIQAGPVVSAEEEIQLMQVATESLNEMEAAHSDMARLQGLAEGLEGLVEVCGHIKEASATDICLVESAAELALVGSEVAVEEIMPGLESNVGSTVGVEGIKEVIKNIWESMVKMLKKIWKKVQEFFASIFKAVPRLRKAAEKLRKRAEEAAGKTSEETKVEVGRLNSVFCKGANYDVIQSDEVISELRKYNEVAGEVFESYTKDLEGQAKDITAAIGEYDPESKPADVDKVTAAVVKTVGCLVEKVFKSDRDLPKNDKRFVDLNAGFSSRNMLMGRTFIAFGPTETDRLQHALAEGIEKSTQALRAVTGIRTNIVMTSDDSDKDLPSEGEMGILSPNQCIDIAEEVLSLCDSMTNYFAGKSFKKIREAGDKMKKATDKKADQVAKAADKIGGDQQAAWRAVAACNTAWSGWATRTQAQFEGHLMSVARASLDLANKSLAQYK